MTSRAARTHGFLRNVDEEVHLALPVQLLEVAVRAHLLEARISNELPDIAFPQWKHVQRVVTPVGERVLEAGQAVVDVFRLRSDLIAAVVVRVLRREAVIEHGVVLAADAPVQLAPISLDGVEYEPVFRAVLECLAEHGRRAVDTGDVKAGLRQTDGMKAGARSNVEHAHLAVS